MALLPLGSRPATEITSPSMTALEYGGGSLAVSGRDSGLDVFGSADTPPMTSDYRSNILSTDL